MINPAPQILRRSVLKALLLTLAGCGGGEPVVVQPTSDRLERMKGADKKSQAPGDPKAK